MESKERTKVKKLFNVYRDGVLDLNPIVLQIVNEHCIHKMYMKRSFLPLYLGIHSLDIGGCTGVYFSSLQANVHYISNGCHLCCLCSCVKWIQLARKVVLATSSI